MAQMTCETPFGPLTLTETSGAITAVGWGRSEIEDTTVLLQDAAAQLADYCAGRRRDFSLPLNPAGGRLQQAVCAAMRAIPFGETATYGDIARSVNASAQAVGQACGRNPIPILIPCHRVMGAGGKLTGFSGAGGVETKIALLRHEGAGSFLL